LPRFNEDTDMRAPIREAVSRPLATGDAGFTLIELTGVIAVIAVLTGVLLPAVQAVREVASRESAVRTLERLCQTGVAFATRKGRFPETLLELTGPADPVSDGAHEGRRYAVRTSPRWSVVAEPLAGVTGQEGATAHPDGCQPTFYPAPGAAAGRLRMIEQLAVAAARAVADLVALATPGDVRVLLAEARSSAALPETQWRVFDALGVTGVISLASVDGALACDGSVHPLSCDGSVYPVVQRFRSDIYHALQLGAYDEEWERLPGVPAEPAAGDALFTIDTLVASTMALVHEPDLETRLLSALQQAARAESSGREPARVAAIGRFLEGIRDGTSIIDGTSLTGGTGSDVVGAGAISVTGARTLETMARAWLGGSDIPPR
jgi:type II secretory pathway pseudopilin PulG